MKYRMSRLQRAKQFMPFAALKGFESVISQLLHGQKKIGARAYQRIK